jgi:hypothetical protein
VPDITSLDVVAVALSCLAMAAIFALRWSIAATLAVCAGAAVLWLGVAT